MRSFTGSRLSMDGFDAGSLTMAGQGRPIWYGSIDADMNPQSV